MGEVSFLHPTQEEECGGAFCCLHVPMTRKEVQIGKLHSMETNCLELEEHLAVWQHKQELKC